MSASDNKVRAWHLDALRKRFALPGFMYTHEFTDDDREVISKYGTWLMKLSRGELPPLSQAQVHFMRAAIGEVKPESRFEHAWLKFAAALESRKDVRRQVSTDWGVMMGDVFRDQEEVRRLIAEYVEQNRSR